MTFFQLVFFGIHQFQLFVQVLTKTFNFFFLFGYFAGTGRYLSLQLFYLGFLLYCFFVPF